MPKFINTTQSDSILVANETIKEVRRKKRSCIIMKYNYEKVYDLK